jgi:hypothetical protein
MRLIALFCTFLFLDSALFSYVEHLTPPPLTDTSILQKIVCTRPYRRGGCNISRQKIDDKTIIHCYGQGALGWSTLFGSVEETILLCNFEKTTPVRVLGAGCMGLTLAIELARRGYCVQGITASSVTDTASCHAGGSFGFSKEMEELGVTSFLTYAQIARNEHPYLSSACARLIDTYCTEMPSAGFQLLEKMGYTVKKKVALDFGNGVRHNNFYKYSSFFIETEEVIQQLLCEVKRLDIPIEIATVGAFSEVNEPIIINCTGRGSYELNHDAKMEPLDGHLIMLAPSPSWGHMDYMLGTKVMQEGKEEYLYLFPKSLSNGVVCQGVIGGTFIPRVERTKESQELLDQKEFDLLLQRHRQFFYGG